MRLTLASLLLLATTPAFALYDAPVPAPTPAVIAALASPARPAADTAKDAARHPAETLAFAGIAPGQRVADFIMGGGYFTRLISLTVGPKGHVYAYQPAEFVAFRAQYGEEQKTTVAALPNATAVNGPLGGFTLPGGLDAIVTVQNYHDLHLKPFAPDTAAKANAALFKALKPGGTLLVVDHVAATGSGLEAPDKLHRIDPAIARAELEQAGFVFAGQSAFLHATADPHTANVFDPAIRGHTDQFVYLFHKPK